MMWQNDGAPPAHPTFALTLYHLKLKQALYGQGLYCANIVMADSTTTTEQIQNAPEGNPLKKEVNKL